MIELIQKLKYKASTWSNLLFGGSAYFHFMADNYFMTMAFLILMASSGIYHYFYAKYHEALESEKGFSRELYKKMKFWQYADVAAIYLVFGFYPYELTGNPWWLLYLIPMTFMIFNKFNVLRPDWNPSTTIAMPVSAVPMVVLGFVNVPLLMMLLGILTFGIAGFFSKTAEELLDSEDYHGYDHNHSVWHNAAAIAFMFIK